ncbi:toxin-antitoxin system protein [Gallibacterium genomosp. 2]|uniref:Toxin-antitoxin system protein n=4 Tax=Gallibacterium TaxID=155493 RepID=A0A0A2Y8C0_9PAST|nr:toxin-antitoxin system protein [Gallibacterium genomosp. 2]KGQ38850.1 toxin-antitoxin system protein [Gallibacterium genomosp. 1]KGQ40590.1 toxin-antitoxin system protein [Gallibacterium anatis]KGQ50053.1 toxin-antitoxin system protein [Gallibacterium anatis 10672-6]KGQ62949.1 toxin-antitoxin system protein [Gallibacterium anatis 7990]
MERIMRTAAINLRAEPSQRDLIDYAASLLGKTRSDFMLDAACIYAQNVILDRTVFQLNDEKFNRFIEILEQPHSTNAGLEKLMNIKSPWE